MKACYGCTDRKPHCHASCERYIDDLAEDRARKDAIRRDREVDDIGRDYLVKRAIKQKRHGRRYG